MHSIDRNQPEENRKNVSGSEAAKKIKELAGQTGTCFFTTRVVTGKPAATRPMSVQKVDEQGNLWFLTAVDSHLVEDLKTDSSAHLYFQGSAHSDFLSLYGKAIVSADKAKIKELWEPICKTWFTEGENDPRIRVVEVTPTEGYYWDNKHGNFVAGIKIMIGAAIGTTLDDSIQGKIKV